MDAEDHISTLMVGFDVEEAMSALSPEAKMIILRRAVTNETWIAIAKATNSTVSSVRRKYDTAIITTFGTHLNPTTLFRAGRVQRLKTNDAFPPKLGVPQSSDHPFLFCARPPSCTHAA